MTSLLDAIDAIHVGKPVATPRTEPVGCRFEGPVSAEIPAAVSYARDIAPILNAHCVTCHRAGEVAPFPLTTYNDAAKRAQWIAEVARKRIMPPWRAEPGYGHFVGERRLTDREIALLSAWAKSDAPEGDLADLPPPRTYASGWSLGEPDIVLKMPTAYTVSADGKDIFWNFVLPMDNDEDLVIKAVEFHPGNPRVVHHAVIMADASGFPRTKDAASPEPGYESLGGGEELATAAWIDQWTPGITTRKLPEGVGFRVRKGTDILINMHYHPNGKVEEDQSTVGIYLARPEEKIERFVTEDPFGVITANIDIPPGISNHHVWKEYRLPVDVTLLSLFPHMHWLGREMKLMATLPDGKELPLIWIERWDFNWQDQYLCREPLRLPKGTLLRLDGWYDNSENSPYQINHPPQRVIIGTNTTDEMCLAIMKVTTDEYGDAMKLRNSQIFDLIREVVSSPMSSEMKMQLVKQYRDRLATERKN